MANQKITDPKQAVARSINQASLKKKQAELMESQIVTQRKQVEGQLRRVEANKVKSSIMVAKTKVAMEKALKNRPPVPTP